MCVCVYVASVRKPWKTVNGDQHGNLWSVITLSGGYVCMYVCVCTCGWRDEALENSEWRSAWVRDYAFRWLCMHECVYVCMSVGMYACLCVCMHVMYA